MIKRLTFISLLLIIVVGVNAQTYCYHCYKKYDKFDVPEPRDSYEYITFKGNLMYKSEKDGGYAIGYNGKRVELLYKYTGKMVDGAYMYASWSTINNLYKKRRAGEYSFDYGHYYLVSCDKSEINYVSDGLSPSGLKIADPFTLCYERCPNGDCEKPKVVPGMKH